MTNIFKKIRFALNIKTKKERKEEYICNTINEVKKVFNAVNYNGVIWLSNSSNLLICNTNKTIRIATILSKNDIVIYNINNTDNIIGIFKVVNILKPLKNNNYIISMERLILKSELDEFLYNILTLKTL